MASAVPITTTPTHASQAASDLVDICIPFVERVGRRYLKTDYVILMRPSESVLVICKTEEAVQAFFEREKGLAGLRFVRQDKNRKSILMERCMGGDVSLEQMLDIVRRRFGREKVDEILVQKYANPNEID